MRTIPNDYSHYKPIDSAKREIRVLVLHPAASPKDPVTCSLVRTSLTDDEPCYEAISYCWGNLDDTNVLGVWHHEDSVGLCGSELCDAGGQIGAISDGYEKYAILKHDEHFQSCLHSSLREVVQRLLVAVLIIIELNSEATY